MCIHVYNKRLSCFLCHTLAWEIDQSVGLLVAPQQLAVAQELHDQGGIFARVINQTKFVKHCTCIVQSRLVSHLACTIWIQSGCENAALPVQHGSVYDPRPIGEHPPTIHFVLDVTEQEVHPIVHPLRVSMV